MRPRRYARPQRLRRLPGGAHRFRRSGYGPPVDCGRSLSHSRRQGLPGLPRCAGVPVRRACRTEAVPLAVGLIEGHGAGGEREPGPGARMPPGPRTGLRDGRAAGRVPAVPGRSGAGRPTPARNHRAGRVPAGGRTPVNVAVEPAVAAPGRRVQEGAAARCVAPGRAITLSDT